MSLDLLLIRHAPVAQTGRYMGHTDLSALLPETTAPSSLLRTAASDALWIASPLARARQTAHWLRALHALPEEPLSTDARLREQRFGLWENEAYDAVWQKEAAAHDWNNPAHIHPPQGESFAEMMARVQGWLEEIVASNASHCIAVTHAGPIRAALAHALGLSAGEALRQPCDYCSLTHLRYHPIAAGYRPEVVWANHPLF